MACEHLVSTLGTYKVISSFFKFALFKCNVCRYSAVLTWCTRWYGQSDLVWSGQSSVGGAAMLAAARRRLSVEDLQRWGAAG
jgi:hypothetical protein